MKRKTCDSRERFVSCLFYFNGRSLELGMSASQKVETANQPRDARVASVLSGDSYTDRALWQLSVILAGTKILRSLQYLT